MKQLRSIRSILVLAFTLSLVIPVLVMMLYAHFITGRALANQALERELHDVTLQAQHIEQSLSHIREDAAYLVRLRSLQQFQNGSTTIHDIEQDFIVFANAKPMMQRLLYLHNNSIAIGIDNSSTTPRLIDTDVMRSLAYQEFLQSYRILDAGEFAVSFDIVWDKPVLRYSMGVEDGVLVIEVLASWVLRNMPGIEANSIWAILHNSGQHLLFPLPDESYPSAIPATDAAISPYLESFRLSDAGTIKAEKNSFIYSRIFPTGNHDDYWLLYKQMPQSELYAVVNDFYRTSTLILLIAMIASLALSGFIAGQFIRPLMALQRKVADFAEGKPFNNLVKPLKITELNELHESFHGMVQQLTNERTQKRHLIKQLISAQEDERKRIAYDLHDGLIQQLVVAKMYTSMQKNDANEAQLANLKQSEDALSTAIVEGRRIIEGLHPTVLDDLGLVDAITEIANQEAIRYGWELDLQLETLPRDPDKTISITVFRIVQEALNNAGKHAKAKHVAIYLSNGDAVRLSIQDDGIGFDSEAEQFSSGFGIGTMRERAMSLSGLCRVESQLEQGTRVTVHLPYE